MEEQEKIIIVVMNYNIIEKVKESVNINVIGNGDIFDVKSALTMFERTNCDGIMVARGAMGNPWIFKSILDGKDYIPTNEEKLEMIFKHIDYMCKYYGEKLANLKCRKHIAWYLKGLNKSTKVKDAVNKAESIEKVKEILTDYFKSLS